MKRKKKKSINHHHHHQKISSTDIITISITMSLPYTIELNIPFETSNQAEIAKNTLSPDPILRSDELTIDYATDSNNLKVKFSGVSDRVIRVAISNMIDNIKTIIECMDEFDGKKDHSFELQDYKNNG
ncbi:component of the EKC/KEOPS complex, putative [Candida dubliniensis CD36]|uniref:Transcription factor, putative n=1 Tax=Candida dubliniensis (strain CD36 / ATCC MYA-646 / CBS 7987 / NCPF 3949 / NRRL Y-17841) TaxID=573826 RepID=B9WGS1_CANDC|nr:component of the EKC/KEOPS complex, putative [Candida dubliniensis CD36]CAX42447.1 component of the EKC/KEOPS complex, putative [Candida dubliniensis CD36]